MKQVQRGFTLIELVMVIVILGVLAAVAIPKFLDLSTDANKAATQGVAGAISSASSVNYAARAVGTTNGTKIDSAKTCQTAAAAILQGGIPTGYTLDNATALSGTAGTVNTCVVTNSSNTSITAAATVMSTSQ